MKPFLIGLAGLSGAGKSTLADHLEAQGGVKRFRLDAFYKNAQDCPKLVGGQPHWDLPESLHLDEVKAALLELRAGSDIFLPVYNRRLCERTGSMLYKPAPVIFAEGLQLFADASMRNLFDLRLWLDIDEGTALERRLQRQPDYDLDYHARVALPAQRAHVLPKRVHAHVYVDGSQPIRDVAAAADAVIHQHLGILHAIA